MSNKRNYKYGFHDNEDNYAKVPKGHSVEIIKKISKIKNEPEWMLKIRLDAYEIFLKTPTPKFIEGIEEVDFDEMDFFVKPTKNIVDKWEDIPQKIRDTFDRLGISKKEQEWLGGMATQYDSEMVYANVIKEIKKMGIIVESTDNAVKKYPEIVKKYFGKIVKTNNNKYAALNTAFWSGGTFIYVPKNIKVERPVQSYFRINSRRLAQFERTLIIVEENSSLNYVEGCTAPTFTFDNLHAGVVELFVKKNAHCRYTTIQNWSDNVVNLVTKSAIVEENGIMEWIDGNLGGRINLKYPSTILKGDNSKANALSVAIGIGKNIFHDVGAKVIHIGKNTQSTILSKSLAGFGSKVNYRGLVHIDKKAINSKSKVVCDTIILDKDSKSNTYPKNVVLNNNSSIEHEASVSSISEEELFYLQTKGISEKESREMIIMGFIEPLVNVIPLEYSSELSSLIKTKLDDIY